MYVLAIILWNSVNYNIKEQLVITEQDQTELLLLH